MPASALLSATNYPARAYVVTNICDSLQNPTGEGHVPCPRSSTRLCVLQSPVSPYHHTSSPQEHELHSVSRQPKITLGSRRPDLQRHALSINSLFLTLENWHWLCVPQPQPDPMATQTSSKTLPDPPSVGEREVGCALLPELGQLSSLARIQESLLKQRDGYLDKFSLNCYYLIWLRPRLISSKTCGPQRTQSFM